MLPIVTALINMGLPLISAAVQKKGQQVIEEKLGIKLAVDMTPAEILAAKQKEIDHEEFLITAASEDFKTEIADKNSARQMQIAALDQEDLVAKRFLYYLATGLLTFTGVYVLAITFTPVPEANQRFADTILGFLLGTVVSTIIYFFFGTSKSSKDKDVSKDNLLSKLTDR